MVLTPTDEGTNHKNNNNSSINPIPSEQELKELHDALMKLSELKIIIYRIVDAHHIGIQYHKEYADFISKNKEMLKLKTMESIVHATLAGFPMSAEESKLAAHTTNIIIYTIVSGREKQLPLDPKAIVPLALAINSVEDMVMEQILIDDDAIEKAKRFKSDN